MDVLRELADIVKELNEIEARSKEADIKLPIEAIMSAASEAGLAFSGSWLGYHSRVYYRGLQKPPPGAHFSQEWGLKGDSFLGLGSKGAWEEFDYDWVKSEVLNRAGDPDLKAAKTWDHEARATIKKCKNSLSSILVTELAIADDEILRDCQSNLKNFELTTIDDVAAALSPRKQYYTRDTTAIGQGTQVPPHISVQLECLCVGNTSAVCKEIAGVAENLASHLQRKRPSKTMSSAQKIFIGHGGSSAWKDLRDFVKDRLRLEWEEFNRVSTAGIATTERLKEMLENASFAFIVLTAEDERANGKMQARMNVIHEAGLFQGKLGFRRAIILLEDGCEEFSNIHGLGQIRFKTGNLEAKFEEIRRVLEREKILL